MPAPEPETRWPDFCGGARVRPPTPPCRHACWAGEPLLRQLTGAPHAAPPLQMRLWEQCGGTSGSSAAAAPAGLAGADPGICCPLNAESKCARLTDEFWRCVPGVYVQEWHSGEEGGSGGGGNGGGGGGDGGASPGREPMQPGEPGNPPETPFPPYIWPPLPPSPLPRPPHPKDAPYPPPEPLPEPPAPRPPFAPQGGAAAVWPPLSFAGGARQQAVLLSGGLHRNGCTRRMCSSSTRLEVAIRSRGAPLNPPLPLQIARGAARREPQIALELLQSPSKRERRAGADLRRTCARRRRLRACAAARNGAHVSWRRLSHPGGSALSSRARRQRRQASTTPRLEKHAWLCSMLASGSTRSQRMPDRGKLRSDREPRSHLRLPDAPARPPSFALAEIIIDLAARSRGSGRNPQRRPRGICRPHAAGHAAAGARPGASALDRPSRPLGA